MAADAFVRPPRSEIPSRREENPGRGVRGYVGRFCPTGTTSQQNEQHETRCPFAVEDSSIGISYSGFFSLSFGGSFFAGGGGVFGLAAGAGCCSGFAAGGLAAGLGLAAGVSGRVG